MRRMRKLSKSFMNDLINEGEVLHPILERVRCDDTLMLAIRNKYINIYYRGGNILKVEEGGESSYRASFDIKFAKPGEKIPTWPATIEDQDDARMWVAAFPRLKEIMNTWFFNHPKLEREFQQLVARENYYAPTSKNAKYFVADIEFAYPGVNACFDMLAIRWLASDCKSGGNCRATLIEMKYGDNALGAGSGLLKHLRDIDVLVSDKEKYKSLLEMMESQFNQLDELGLVKYNQSSNKTKIQLDASDPPEVIFLLADHNPRSTKLSSILDDPEVLKYEKNNRFELRFFVSQFAGYGLHSDCMLTLTQFKELLKR
jgi:hypothetical protein